MQLGIDNLLVAHRIDRAIYMHYIFIIETTKYMNDGIGFADISEELIAQAFALTGTFD